MRWLAVLLPLLTAACAQEPPLEAQLQPFIGQSEAALVGALGVPSETYTTEGTTEGLRFLQYEERTSTTYPGASVGPGRFGRFGTPILLPPVVVRRVCAITFTVRDSQVTGFTLRGNGCR